LVGLYNRQKLDMLTIEEQEILKAKKRKLDECKKKLKNLQDRQQNQKKNSVIIVEKLLIQLLLLTLI
jgi:hypothetical protein